MNNYFYIDLDGVQHGPLPLSQLITNKYLRPETMVWNNTLVDWQRADSVDELKECLSDSNIANNPPPAPSQSQSSEQNTNNNREQNSAYYYQNYQNKMHIRPENWLVWNILATIMCCSIIPGIIGIIFSNKVDRLWAIGQYDEAIRAANTAKILFFVSLGILALGILWNIGYILTLLSLKEVAYDMTLGLPVI